MQCPVHLENGEDKFLNLYVGSMIGQYYLLQFLSENYFLTVFGSRGKCQITYDNNTVGHISGVVSKTQDCVKRLVLQLELARKLYSRQIALSGERGTECVRLPCWYIASPQTIL